MTGRLEDFIKESRIIRDIENTRQRLIMVIGVSDSGKTALVECLADHLSKKVDVGIADLDMGQSHISLPTTIAWGRVRKGFNSWQSIKVEDFYFTGVLSPVGSLLPAVAGAKLITDRALASCQKVIVDTTGLISGPVGRILKQYKIDILSPDIILALERGRELGHILDCFRSHTSPGIYRLPVPGQVSTKSTEKRTQYRLELFRSYFTGALTHVISFEDIGIRFAKDPERLGNAELKNRIVSFRDERNTDIALGIIKEVHPRRRQFLIKSPINKAAEFAAIVIGAAQIDLL